jgi:hypothetical protein
MANGVTAEARRTMVTTIAFYLLTYCVGVLGGGVLLRLCARRRPRMRSLALRLIAVFGIFAVAAGYVWLDLGPQIDQRIALHDQPLLLPAPPLQIEI